MSDYKRTPEQAKADRVGRAKVAQLEADKRGMGEAYVRVLNERDEARAALRDIASRDCALQERDPWTNELTLRKTCTDLGRPLRDTCPACIALGALSEEDDNDAT